MYVPCSWLQYLSAGARTEQFMLTAMLMIAKGIFRIGLERPMLLHLIWVIFDSMSDKSTVIT